MRLLLWGNGEIARVARSYFSRSSVDIKSPSCCHYYQGSFSIYNILDKEYCKEADIDYESYKPPLTNESDYIDCFFPSVAYTKCNRLREEVLNKMLSKFDGTKNQILSIIDKRATVDTQEIGEGSWIQELCSIQTGVKIGKGVVCWANSHVGHSTVMEDFSWVTSCACICGEAYIGKGAFIGANAVVAPGVKIAEHTLVGSGAIITRDTKPYEVYLEGRNNLLKSKLSTDLL